MSSCKLFPVVQLEKAVRRLFQNRKLQSRHFQPIKSLWLWKLISGCGCLWKGSTVPQKKRGNRAATEITQELPHAQPISCNYSKGRSQGRAPDASSRTDIDGLSSLPGSGADAQGQQTCELSATAHILQGPFTEDLYLASSPFTLAHLLHFLIKTTDFSVSWENWCKQKVLKG